jgi:hypothetical protein
MQLIQAMPALADLIIHDIVKNYSAYSMPVWQPERIKNAISLLSEDIAEKLNYTNGNECAKSVSKILNVDITPYLVKHKYPVWVDVERENILTHIDRSSNKLVITYTDGEYSETGLIQNIKHYSESVNADFIVLTGRTQGYKQLEKHRIKHFAEKYDRTLYIADNLLIKNNYPDLFQLVPEGQVGLCDDRNIANLKNNYSSKIFLLKADAFSKFHTMDTSIYQMVKYECDLMQTEYDDSLVLCDKKDAAIWSPFSFPYRFKKDENKAWMEILIYRNGCDVYKLENSLNNTFFDNSDIEVLQKAYAIRYEGFHTAENIVHTWIYSNNITGYKDKPPIDTTKFKILSLYHKEEQLESILPRKYLQFVNLNDLQSRFDNSFTESRIYYEDFDHLFPSEYDYLGLTTGSWNLKYVGLNPIDQLHNWEAINNLDDNVILCSDSEKSSRFFKDKKSVLHEIFPSITVEQINEFIDLIGLEKIDKEVAIANQIIAKRDILKSLFDFYQKNEILDKIAYFYNKYNFKTRNEKMYFVRSGFFSEFATIMWVANQDFTIMPQEVLKRDWYW